MQDAGGFAALLFVLHIGGVEAGIKDQTSGFLAGLLGV
jgi:hypothetical protein